MQSLERLGFAGLMGTTALAATLTICTPASAAEVTYQRLLNASAEPQNWLMRMGNYANWNHSALTQINHDNVANLKVKFMASLGDPNRPNKGNRVFHAAGRGWLSCMSATSISSTGSSTSATKSPTWCGSIDAKVQGGGKSAAQRRAARQQHVFQHRQRQPESAAGRARQEFRRGGVRRGHHDTGSASAESGHSAAPVAVKDIILVGRPTAATRTARLCSGLFRRYRQISLAVPHRIPEPGQPGSETWADPRTIPIGGGGVWTEPSFDPETNLAYFGTGNPVHMFDPQGRPGDNLYTNSIIALDVDTGKLKWYFQTIPNEVAGTMIRWRSPSFTTSMSAAKCAR